MIAGAVAVLFALQSVFPALRGVYQQRQEGIEEIRLEIEREQRLFEESIAWANRRAETEVRRTSLEEQVFTGQTFPLIEANIQRALTQYARDAQMNVTSTRLAERLETDGWLMVRQEMSFRTVNATNTIMFLQRLGEANPRLWVTGFAIDRTRDQFTGSITVVGFARTEGVQVAQATTR